MTGDKTEANLSLSVMVDHAKVKRDQADDNVDHAKSRIHAEIREMAKLAKYFS
jgi:hypothetical protein